MPDARANEAPCAAGRSRHPAEALAEAGSDAASAALGEDHEQPDGEGDQGKHARLRHGYGHGLLLARVAKRVVNMDMKG